MVESERRIIRWGERNPNDPTISGLFVRDGDLMRRTHVMLLQQGDRVTFISPAGLDLTWPELQRNVMMRNMSPEELGALVGQRFEVEGVPFVGEGLFIEPSHSSRLITAHKIRALREDLPSPRGGILARAGTAGKISAGDQLQRV